MQCWSYRIWEFYQLLKLCLLWSLYFWWWIIGGYLEIISEDVNIPSWTCQAALHWPLGSPIGNSCINKAPCLKSEKGIGLTYYRFAMDSLSNRLDEGMEVWIDANFLKNAEWSSMKMCWWSPNAMTYFLLFEHKWNTTSSLSTLSTTSFDSLTHPAPSIFQGILFSCTWISIIWGWSWSSITYAPHCLLQSGVPGCLLILLFTLSMNICTVLSSHLPAEACLIFNSSR